MKTLNTVRGKKPMPFTLIEYRLFFSRAVILNEFFNKENIEKELLDLARFYFKDIAVLSISSDHLAKISRAYFLAVDGSKTEAEKMAKEGYKELLIMNKGDFFTRLWFFYDMFIYGKTNELLGNKTEAINGYKECIKANPHTNLAKRAKERLNILKK